MKIIKLRLVELNLRMLGFMMNLHSFDIRSGDFAVRTFKFGVTAFDLAGTIGMAGFAAAAIGGGGVKLGGELFGGVLLWLGFSGHG